MSGVLRRVVVGYDFSEMADDAFAWAVDLARPSGAHVSLVHVARAAGDDDPALAERRAELAAVMQDLPDVSSHVVAGESVSDRLIAFADETDADLIVVGMTTHSAVERWVLGSVADQVLHRAHCPVVAYRTDDG
ncbi:MAG: universal stress protein [Polyangiales bacterium]